MEHQTLQQHYVRYPQGAGGAWLRTVIAKVYRQDLDQHNNINAVNYHVKGPLTRLFGHEKKNCGDIVFGGCAGFNFFLNFWWKKRIFENYLDFNDTSDLQKLKVLSMEARWILFSEDYRNNYWENVALDWVWLWKDTTMFKKTLCRIFDIPEDQNTDCFLDSQIENYKKTCVSTKYHVGNPFSLPWLSWCHAIITEHQLDLGIDLCDSRDLVLLSRYISNNIDQFTHLTGPRMIHIGDL